MNILTWFKRLFGNSRPKVSSAPQPKTYGIASHPAKVAQNRSSPTPFSPLEFANVVRELQRKAALWPEIWATLNPDHDPEVQRLLVELRGPHMFAPHVALNAIEEACHRRLQHDRDADRVTIIQAALKSCEPFSQ